MRTTPAGARKTKVQPKIMPAAHEVLLGIQDTDVKLKYVSITEIPVNLPSLSIEELHSRGNRVKVGIGASAVTVDGVYMFQNVIRDRNRTPGLGRFVYNYHATCAYFKKRKTIITTREAKENNSEEEGYDNLIVASDPSAHNLGKVHKPVKPYHLDDNHQYKLHTVTFTGIYAKFPTVMQKSQKNVLEASLIFEQEHCLAKLPHCKIILGKKAITLAVPDCEQYYLELSDESRKASQCYLDLSDESRTALFAKNFLPDSMFYAIRDSREKSITVAVQPEFVAATREAVRKMELAASTIPEVVHVNPNIVVHMEDSNYPTKFPERITVRAYMCSKVGIKPCTLKVDLYIEYDVAKRILSEVEEIQEVHSHRFEPLRAQLENSLLSDVVQEKLSRKLVKLSENCGVEAFKCETEPAMMFNLHLPNQMGLLAYYVVSCSRNRKYSHPLYVKSKQIYIKFEPMYEIKDPLNAYLPVSLAHAQYDKYPEGTVLM